jgi:hypothetical protein
MLIITRLICVIFCTVLCLAAGLTLGAVWAEGSGLIDSPDTYAPKLLIFVCGLVATILGPFVGKWLSDFVVRNSP